MLFVSLIWRYSEAAVTRRTRNAFVGSSRHKGSNPFISAFNQEETTAELTEEILQWPLFALENHLFDTFIGCYHHCIIRYF